MSKLRVEQVKEELKGKNYTLSPNSPEYKNLNSIIHVVCDKGHTIQTSLKSIRHSSFFCPLCAGEDSKGFDNAPVGVPRKTDKFRIVGIDNATQNMGVSIFDDGKLVYYKLYNFSAPDHIDRLLKIRDLIEDIIIREWRPDFIQFEDIQFQHNYGTYEVLIKLIGLFEMTARRHGIKYSKDRSVVWRSHLGINGGGRAVEKRKAINLVKEMYNITVGDDVAEAILIGKFRADLEQRNNLKDLF